MFGEEFMLGNEERYLDDKGRVSLPSFCKADKDDKVIILSMGDYIEIWGEIEFYKYLEYYQIDPFAYSDSITAFIVLKDVNIDALKRINLTKRLVGEYKLSNEVHVEGKGKFIRIWNPTKFLEYQKKMNDTSLALKKVKMI